MYEASNRRLREQFGIVLDLSPDDDRPRVDLEAIRRGPECESLVSQVLDETARRTSLLG